MCTDINWGGPCQYITVPIDACHELGSYANIVSSFGPDLGASCALMV